MYIPEIPSIMLFNMNIAEISSILLFICIMLTLPTTVFLAVVLCFGKGRISKGLWIAVCALNILGFLGMIVLERVMQVVALHYVSNATDMQWIVLKQLLLPTLCFGTALLFPPVATMGRKGGWKPLILLPALLYCLLGPVFSMNGLSHRDILLTMLLRAPLVLIMLLTAVWYYTGKKTVVGVLTALAGVGILLTMPLLSATVGRTLMLGDGITEVLGTILTLFRGLVNQGPSFITVSMRAGGFPSMSYAMVIALTLTGLHSKRLPKETDAAAAAPAPAPAKAKPVPAAPASEKKYCMHCGCKLAAGQRFCMNCGKEA